MLVQPDSTRLPLDLKKVKDEGREGIYVEQFTALQEGDYRIELQHPAAADQLLVREVRVKIPAEGDGVPRAERRCCCGDIADKTGGDYFVGMRCRGGQAAAAVQASST